MSYKVTLIPGDGIGYELTEATRRVLEATGVDFRWDVQQAGTDVMETEGTPLPPRVLESLQKTKVGIKGPITTPVGTGLPRAADQSKSTQPLPRFHGSSITLPRSTGLGMPSVMTS